MAGLPGKTVALGSPQSSIHQISQVELGDWMTEIEGLTGLSGFAFVRGSAAALAGLGADGNYALVVTTAAERGIYLRASGSWSKVADLPLILTESLAADQAEADRILAQAAAASADDDATAAAASAVAAASSQSLADVARTQAQIAAVAAGATIYASVAAGEAATVNGDVFLVSTEPGVQVYENSGGTGSFLGWLGEILLDDVSAVAAWSPPAYPQTGLILRTRKNEFAYEVLASGASDEELTTAGGVKLRVLPGADGAVSVQAFGAVGDGVTDDTAAIQAAIDAAILQRNSVFLPRTNLGSLGLYRTTSPLLVSGRVRIYGESTNYCGIRCEGCSGFVISAGVNFVTIEKLLIAQDVRYSTTANNYKGIETLGTTGSRNFWHIYRDLFIDGFQWAMQLSYTWSTVINSVTSVFGFGGVYAPGLSVNNFVSNCSFGGSRAAGSAGIKIGDGTVSTEGWMIQDNLIAEFDIGVWGLGAGNCHVRGCIIDFFQKDGVLLQSSAASGAINWIVSENYMATDNAAGANGIRLKNDFAASSDQNRGHLINGNQILKYSGAALSYGINVDGTAETGCVISGNRVDASDFACYLFTGTAPIVSSNYWKGGVFRTDVPVQYINNKGAMASGIYPSPEGTFTPAVFGSTVAGAGTYTVQYGTYKIVDNICFFTLRVNWSAHTGTGLLRISGLPVASQAGVSIDPCVTVNAENLTFPAGTTSIIGIVKAGETNIEIRGSGSGVVPTGVAMDATGNIAISGFYEIY